MLNVGRIGVALLWVAICGGVAGIASYFFDAPFWPSALLVALALLANGLLAFWEDRGTFND
jgi:hypothetical protein